MIADNDMPTVGEILDFYRLWDGHHVDALTNRFPMLTLLQIEYIVAVFDPVQHARKSTYPAGVIEALEEEAGILAHILHGLGTSTDEACRLRAARGDPIALAYLVYVQNRQYRLEEVIQQELHIAALIKHPGWQMDGNFCFRRVDPNAPYDFQLAGWLRINHPAEAYEAEQRACRSFHY
jgi:hypothetical protein